MRVVQVKKVQLAEAVPVYDLSVPGPENFKLANGPFVHNSKDVADALAGVVYGLTMRREIWGLFSIPVISVPPSLRVSQDKLEEKNDRLTEAQNRQYGEAEVT